MLTKCQLFYFTIRTNFSSDANVGARQSTFFATLRRLDVEPSVATAAVIPPLRLRCRDGWELWLSLWNGILPVSDADVGAQHLFFFPLARSDGIPSVQRCDYCSLRESRRDG